MRALRSSMTSFACRLEPRSARRLAAAAVLLHATVAASPWMLGVPAALAAMLSAVALLGLPSTLSCLPGPHHRVAALLADADRCRLWLAGQPEPGSATLGRGSRAFAQFAFVELESGSGRHAWLLPRSSLPPAAFRRLKALIRLTC